MINFSDIKATLMPNFKGGDGVTAAQMFVDDKNKIMRITLEPGSSIGMHCHDESCEIIYVLSGIGAVTGWQWVIVAIGYIGIIFVMFSGARRLEIRQNKNYGNDPEYQKYVKTVPIMVPFIPLYSVEKFKWLVA